MKRTLLGMTLFAGLGVCSAAETPAEFVVNSVEAMLSKPFCAEMVLPKNAGTVDRRSIFSYQPGKDGTFMEKVEITDVKANIPVMANYSINGKIQSVRLNKNGDSILLKPKNDDWKLETALTSAVFFQMDYVFRNIKDVAALPGVVFSEEPEETLNKDIPCRVIKMTQAATFGELLRQLGFPTQHIPEMEKEKHSPIPPDLYFKWYIGKKDGFVYKYTVVIPGQPPANSPEWSILNVTFPAEIDAKTFQPQAGLATFEINTPKDLQNALMK